MKGDKNMLFYDSYHEKTVSLQELKQMWQESEKDIFSETFQRMITNSLKTVLKGDKDFFPLYKTDSEIEKLIARIEKGQ